MNPLIVGSNLTDLGRNSLAAAQQEQDASQATSNRLLQYLMEQNKNRQAQGDLSYRNRALDADSSYRNNALAQQMQMWNTPNANTIEANKNNLIIANLPYEKMTPAQQAEIELRKKIIEMQGAGGYGFLDPATRDKLIMDKHREAQDSQKAADMLNQITAANADVVANPTLKERLDEGADNPGGIINWFGKGLYSGNAGIAADSLTGKQMLPPGWESDNAIKGTQAWYGANKNQFLKLGAKKTLNEHPDIAALAEWDDANNRWVPKGTLPTTQPTTQSPLPNDGKAIPGLALFQGGASNAPSTNTPIAQPAPFRIGNFTVTPIR